MRTILARALLLAATVCALTGAEEPPPAISPKSMEKIQRLTLVLRLLEYPQPQGTVLSNMAEVSFQDLGGSGGLGRPFREKLALTDPNGPVGYYGVNLYIDFSAPGEKHPVTQAEVFFQPRYSEEFPDGGVLVLKVNDLPDHYINALREYMHKMNLTPVEVVRQLDSNGLPTGKMLETIDPGNSQAPAKIPSK